MEWIKVRTQHTMDLSSPRRLLLVLPWTRRSQGVQQGGVVPTAGGEASAPTGDPSLAFLLHLLQPKAAETSLKKLWSPAWSHGVSVLELKGPTVPPLPH